MTSCVTPSSISVCDLAGVGGGNRPAACGLQARERAPRAPCGITAQRGHPTPQLGNVPPRVTPPDSQPAARPRGSTAGQPRSCDHSLAPLHTGHIWTLFTCDDRAGPFPGLASSAVLPLRSWSTELDSPRTMSKALCPLNAPTPRTLGCSVAGEERERHGPRVRGCPKLRGTNDLPLSLIFHGVCMRSLPGVSP